jgi:hypothetical protein
VNLRRELERVEIPGEHEARERAWPIVRAAFAEREPARPGRAVWRPLIALAVVAAVVATVLSPPGDALLDSVRDAVGVEEADEALFDLPGGGRLLVQSEEGPWVVEADGSKRLLDRYDEASWSPFGRFVVAARANELATLEPDGDVHWKLARPSVRFPRWGGTRTDTRIAYLSGSGLRVVAGDGSPDRAACADVVAPVAPAWRPGGEHVLAFVAPRGEVYVYDIDNCAQWWRSRAFPDPRKLAWSPDGKRLLLVARDQLVVFRSNSAQPLAVRRTPGILDAAFSTDGRIAIALPNEIRVGNRRVFAGTGQIAWSPDGRWLLVAFRQADQWVFVATSGPRRIQAVSNVAGQFESSRFPRLAGWCCASR